MASSTETTFRNAVIAAESARQTSKSVAFAAYAFDPSGYSTYKTAVSDADKTYNAAIATAADASNLTVGCLGQCGPIPGAPFTPLLEIG